MNETLKWHRRIIIAGCMVGALTSFLVGEVAIGLLSMAAVVMTGIAAKMTT